nr:E3 ubiquitin-protein ligase BRE1-like 2 [Tanacetum cinerariifolium]
EVVFRCSLCGRFSYPIIVDKGTPHNIVSLLMHEEFVNTEEPGDGVQYSSNGGVKKSIGNTYTFIQVPSPKSPNVNDGRGSLEGGEADETLFIKIQIAGWCIDVLELLEAIKTKGREAESYMYKIETIGRAYEDIQTHNQHLMQQVVMERVDYNIKTSDDHRESSSSPKYAPPPPPRVNPPSPNNATPPPKVSPPSPEYVAPPPRLSLPTPEYVTPPPRVNPPNPNHHEESPSTPDFYCTRASTRLKWCPIPIQPLTGSYQLVLSLRALFERASDPGKKLNIKEKIDIVLSWPSEEAPPVIKGSLDANEDIGVVKVSSTIDDVFDIGESSVESIEVRSELSKFSENKENVKDVVGGGEFNGRLDEINFNLSEELADNGGWMSDSQSAYSSYHLKGKVIFKGGRSVTSWVAKGRRMVSCYVQGSGSIVHISKPKSNPTKPEVFNIATKSKSAKPRICNIATKSKSAKSLTMQHHHQKMMRHAKTIGAIEQILIVTGSVQGNDSAQWNVPVKFNNKEGMNHVLERGTWMFRNKPLLVQKWDLSLCIEKKDPECTSSLGKPVIMDQTTIEMCNKGMGRIRCEFCKVFGHLHANFFVRPRSDEENRKIRSDNGSKNARKESNDARQKVVNDVNETREYRPKAKEKVDVAHKDGIDKDNDNRKSNNGNKNERRGIDEANMEENHGGSG